MRVGSPRVGNCSWGTTSVWTSRRRLYGVRVKDEPPRVPGETRDWTFILDAGCPECGYELHDPRTTADRLAATVPRWREALGRPGADDRADAAVWSPVEYGCHSRDMVRLLGERVQAMVSEDDPQFANWDGDEKAVELKYWAADPLGTAEEIALQTDRTVGTLTALQDDQWDRRGHRSDGAPFTVSTLCQYLLHDIEHHLADVRA